MRTIAIGLTLFGLFQTQFLSTFSQYPDIESPLNIPLLLSGNFGELRSTHFHAGIDLKTQGETGKPVSSILDGYVSRIKVRAGGYGNALYIQHENGYTSVYGHLQEYYSELEAYIKDEQYRRKSFEVDIYLKKNEFVVKKGQLIGISGNTGRSGGPHLHFEIRNGNQVPLNVLKFNLPIKDSISPKFKKLVVYNGLDSLTYSGFSKKIYSVSGRNSKYKINEPIAVGNNFAFGTEVYDYLNGSLNKCGVYELELFFDNTSVYSFTIEAISFNETRNIKSHMDYAEKKLNKRNVHKLFREPNNKLNIYNTIINNGILNLKDTLLHEMVIKASDVYGNKSELNFTVFYNEKLNRSKADSGEVYISYKIGGNFENDELKFEIEPDGIYSNKWLTYSKITSDSNYYSNIHLLGDELVAVKKYPQLTLEITKTLDNIPFEKLVIAQINGKGELSSEGGRLENRTINAKVSGFGKYVIVADTISPVITPSSFKSGAWYAANDKISFKITDDLSGIKTYNGYIDNNWALFEYDSKNDLLFYNVDTDKLPRTKSEHKLEVFILDERNNLQKFQGTFYF